MRPAVFFGNRVGLIFSAAAGDELVILGRVWLGREGTNRVCLTAGPPCGLRGLAGKGCCWNRLACLQGERGVGKDDKGVCVCLMHCPLDTGCSLHMDRRHVLWCAGGCPAGPVRAMHCKCAVLCCGLLACDVSAHVYSAIRCHMTVNCSALAAGATISALTSSGGGGGGGAHRLTQRPDAGLVSDRGSACENRAAT